MVDTRKPVGAIRSDIRGGSCGKDQGKVRTFGFLPMVTMSLHVRSTDILIETFLFPQFNKILLPGVYPFNGKVTPTDSHLFVNAFTRSRMVFLVVQEHGSISLRIFQRQRQKLESSPLVIVREVPK